MESPSAGALACFQCSRSSKQQQQAAWPAQPNALRRHLRRLRACGRGAPSGIPKRPPRLIPRPARHHLSSSSRGGSPSRATSLSLSSTSSSRASSGSWRSSWPSGRRRPSAAAREQELATAPAAPQLRRDRGWLALIFLRSGGSCCNGDATREAENRLAHTAGAPYAAGAEQQPSLPAAGGWTDPERRPPPPRHQPFAGSRMPWHTPSIQAPLSRPHCPPTRLRPARRRTVKSAHNPVPRPHAPQSWCGAQAGRDTRHTKRNPLTTTPARGRTEQASGGRQAASALCTPTRVAQTGGGVRFGARGDGGAHGHRQGRRMATPAWGRKRRGAKAQAGRQRHTPACRQPRVLVTRAPVCVSSHVRAQTGARAESNKQSAPPVAATCQRAE